VQRTEPGTGRIVSRRDLPGDLFGEGLALVGEKFYQLTWREGRALVWDMDLRAAGEFFFRGEGWGLCSDGEKLYMSDGSDCIHVVDPATFRRLRTFQVVTDKQTVPFLNELEWIGSQIWANVYMSDRIVRIDPATGHVKGIVDLAGLNARQRSETGEDVLNGIAHDSGRIFVTGKNWSRLFEIEIIEK
jgi:glutamine cyclotransferase